jgi:hypothetical protein
LGGCFGGGALNLYPFAHQTIRKHASTIYNVTRQVVIHFPRRGFRPASAQSTSAELMNAVEGLGR